MNIVFCAGLAALAGIAVSCFVAMGVTSVSGHHWAAHELYWLMVESGWALWYFWHTRDRVIPKRRR